MKFKDCPDLEPKFLNFQVQKLSLKRHQNFRTYPNFEPNERNGKNDESRKKNLEINA